MTSQAFSQYDIRWRLCALLAVVCASLWPAVPAYAADEPDLIFRRSTVFKWLSPNDKLATYGVDDPEVEGVACHFTIPEKGGYKGWLGLAEEVSDISLACRQIGPIRFKARSSRARTCSGSADRCSSRRCRSSVAATPSGTCWSTWCIRTIDRRVAEELDLLRADHAVGSCRRRRGSEMRRVHPLNRS